MDFSKLDYGTVASYSANLQSYSTDMKTLLDEITALFGKIGTDDVWSGTAADSAKVKFDALSKKFPGFYNAILDCATYLNSVIATYQAVDKKVSSQSN